MTAATSIPAPLASVVITTYREEWPKLRRAIESILAQVFSDLELIIVFEGEDANYQRVLETFHDPRLVLSRQPQGVGRSRCHNAGLDLVRGRYVARMDDDDYCYPERLDVEIRFLRENPDIGVVGAGGRLVSKDGRVIGERLFPLQHAQIVRRMAFVNPLLHPTVTWDGERVGADIRYATYHVDDLELWLRMLRQGCRFANLPIILIDYEQPEGRPRKSWWGVLWVRLLHWPLCLRYPRYAIGVALFMVLALVPHALINRITRGHKYIDRLRSIRRNAS